MTILAAAASRYPGQEERLTRGITLDLRDLPDGLVGVAYKSAVLLDTDAGGHGWFVDPTPATDEEFIAGVAPKGSPAHGKMDLLSVLSHEMGHILFSPLGDTMQLLGGSLIVCAALLSVLEREG